MVQILAPLVLVAALCGAVVILHKKAAARRASWAAFAKVNRLELTKGGAWVAPALRGALKGVSVSVRAVTGPVSRRDKKKVAWTVVEVGLDCTVPIGLVVVRADGPRVGVSKHMGEPIGMGDPDLDIRLQIWAGAPELVRSVLEQSGVRERLLSMMEHGGDTMLADGKLRFSLRGDLPVGLKMRLEEAVELAVCLDRAVPEAMGLPAVEAEHEPTLRSASPSIEPKAKRLPRRDDRLKAEVAAIRERVPAVFAKEYHDISSGWHVAEPLDEWEIGGWSSGGLEPVEVGPVILREDRGR